MQNPLSNTLITPMHCLHMHDKEALEKCTETCLNPNYLQIIGCNVQITKEIYLANKEGFLNHIHKQ